MGKRKERRLAALNATRRVKLDLFAEPSGDLGGSSFPDDVGGATDTKHCGRLPNSPSSSGQEQENPLLLLGQYSDDELDEEPREGLDHAVVENTSNDETVKQALHEKFEEVVANEGNEGSAAKKVEQDINETLASPDALQNIMGSVVESDATASLSSKAGPVKQISLPDTSDIIPALGDLNSGWKIVMHEESKQYYYWNPETGETSWAVPDILAQQSALTASTQDYSSILHVELNGSSAIGNTNASAISNLIPQINELHEKGSYADTWDGEYKGEIADPSGVSQVELEKSSAAVTASCNETSIVRNEYCRQSSVAILGNGHSDSQYGRDLITIKDPDTGFDVSPIVNHADRLLEKLVSLKRSKRYLESQDWMSKYILELEIRLSDFKSLESYGSSLLPFWLYSEGKLKQLETAVDGEVCQLSKFEQTKEIPATGPLHSVSVKDKTLESIGEGSDVSGSRDRALVPSPEISHASAAVETLTGVQKDSFAEAPNYNIVDGEGNCKEMDMDVDMDVEDAIPISNTTVADTLGGQYVASLEQIVQPNLELEDEFSAPPPPEEEWIPPPPPDNESIPPPPPPADEPPPEPSYLPAPSLYLETELPLSYTQQYNLSYPLSNFEYYGHTTTEVPRNSYYGETKESLIAVSHSSLYYDAVPDTYPVSVPLTVNPLEPVSFDAAVVSDQVLSVNANDGGSSKTVSIPHGEVNGSTMIGGENDSASLEVSSTLATEQTPAIISIQEKSLSVPSTTIGTVAAAAAAMSAPASKSKVIRTKKRTIAVAPSLRSNKKVSSLVDKWKAAKEELHEDEEDEPENAYEVLEKKKQREIEEWRAHTIASGEAKDNANFQPLGGDWRERVKRKRRAQSINEIVDNPQEVIPPFHAKQQPDLAELGKDLPPGWQVYWDESSKQVYYGKTLTSETTWNRPTT